MTLSTDRIAERIAAAIEALGHRVSVAASGQSASRYVEVFAFDAEADVAYGVKIRISDHGVHAADVNLYVADPDAGPSVTEITSYVTEIAAALERARAEAIALEAL